MQSNSKTIHSYDKVVSIKELVLERKITQVILIAILFQNSVTAFARLFQLETALQKL